MRPGDRERAARLVQLLTENAAELSIACSPSSIESLVGQIIDSMRRNEYVQVLRTRDIPASAVSPTSPSFDPLMAAVALTKEGNIEEACWMVFLYVHFGKNLRGEWRYAREVAGKLGQGGAWDWESVSNNVSDFRNWLDQNRAQLARKDPPGGFGNHRKYESLAGWSSTGTGEAVSSYVQMVQSHGGHASLLAAAEATGTPEEGFDFLYTQVRRVRRFGRMAAFDYCMMLSKVGLANIAPGHAYLKDATGPVRGTQLLFGSSKKDTLDVRAMDALLDKLHTLTRLPFDVLEDAICNWQKSPNSFRPFRG